MGIGIAEVIILIVICTIPLLVLIVFAIIVWGLRKSKPDDTQRVACPYCAEKILAQAKVCRYCGRDIPTENPTD